MTEVLQIAHLIVTVVLVVVVYFLRREIKLDRSIHDNMHGDNLRLLSSIRASINGMPALIAKYLKPK